MATVTKPIALDESFNTTEQTPRNLADVLAEGIDNLVSAVSRIAPQTVYDELDKLEDVDITNPANNDVLKYNSASQKWENGQGGSSGDSVSWNQITQSGTKIAEITINGTKTDVYAPQGSSFSALIIVTDVLSGITITATKGQVVKTATSIGNNQYEIDVDSVGTWTITDGTNTTTVQVSSQTTYNVTLGVPTGSTVTPTDDIQTLLHCANVWDKSYTTLTELLNDTTTLSAVISSNNAIDYLKRSTTFAKSKALVPTMTSNTTPSGECFADSVYDSPYQPYKAFDGDSSTYWVTTNNTTNHWIGYKFSSAQKVRKFKYLVNASSRAPLNAIFQGSNDGNTWVDIQTYNNLSQVQDSIVEEAVINDTAYLYYRIYRVDLFNFMSIENVQFYSTAEGFTENSTAMSYIGLNNYASNTLLADSTWCEAICNSTYFESVLNVKVPVMTSNTTPSGECFGSSNYPSISQFYWAFDNDTTTFWSCGTADYDKPNTAYVGYEFPQKVRIYLAKVLSNYHQNYASSELRIIANDSGTTFTEVSSVFSVQVNSVATVLLTNNNSFKRFGVRGSVSDGTNSWLRIQTLQFYGRADV